MNAPQLLKKDSGAVNALFAPTAGPPMQAVGNLAILLLGLPPFMSPKRGTPSG